MKKRLIIGGMLAVAFAGLPSLSLAGDIANIQPIGFSADGKVFGFQEFGIEESGNLPYSNTYFVDTEDGHYLEGTPFHTELTDKDANLSKARRQNLTAARSQMDKYDLLTNPGLIAAFNPPTELGSPSKTIRYDACDRRPASAVYALTRRDAGADAEGLHCGRQARHRLQPADDRKGRRSEPAGSAPGHHSSGRARMFR